MERGVKERRLVSHIISHSVCVGKCVIMCCHLFHSPVCASGQQTVVFTLKSRSGLEERDKEEKLLLNSPM